MQQNIRHLLDELYDLEPLLRGKEEEIMAIIDTMMKNRPQVEIDEDLRKKLRQDILARFAQKNRQKKFVFSFSNWMIGAMSASFVLLIGINIWNSFLHNNISSELGKKGIENQEGGVATMALPQASDRKMMSNESMMAYPPENMQTIVYSFSGDIILPDGSLPVYKRVQSAFDARSMDDILSGGEFGGINIGGLKNAKLTSLNLSEDRNLGYMVSIDIAGGTASINPNYEKWPQPKCDETGCEVLAPLTQNDLEDEKIILKKIGEFITSLGIKLGDYAEPMIDNSWKAITDATIPDSLTIIYPSKVANKIIYEQNGSPKGITITYDQRQKAISSLYGISKEILEATDSPVTQDMNSLRSRIRSGGQSNQIVENGSGKIINISLTGGELGYMSISRFDNGKNSEYYVPALVFHIENKPQDIYTNSTITIPIIDEFMNLGNNGIVPYAIPEMMMR